MLAKQLLLALQKENIYLAEEKILQLERFASLLKEWNNKFNLTALESDIDIVYKHFLDSLFCLKTDIEWNNKKIIDVGTGAGFPGIPLLLSLDNIDLYLIDSLKKRINFLENVVKDLNYENVTCLHGRAEDFGKNENYRSSFDIALARAVAKLPVLLELCIPFVKMGGFFVALKGPEAYLELEESENALNSLGAQLHNKFEFTLSEFDHKRVILIFQKTQTTPEKYPRKAGIVQKRPLL